MTSIKSVKVACYVAISFYALASFFCAPVRGSVLRDESVGTTSLPEEAYADEATTIAGNRIRRAADPAVDIVTEVPSQDAAVTNEGINDEFVETTVVYRSKREAVTDASTLLDDNGETTVSYRSKREAVTDTTQSDDNAETTVSSRKRRDADTTDSTQADDIEFTTSASRIRREAVTEVTQSDDIDETTTYSRVKREAVTVVTDTTSFDDNLDATTLPGRFRREAVTELVEVTQSDDTEETTLSSRVRREISETESTLSDDTDGTTASYRVRREAAPTEIPVFDDLTTLVPRTKRDIDVTDSTLSDDLNLIEETTSYSRVKREAPEIATETITANELVYDATEKTDTRSNSDDSDNFDFRYPTTPFPFPSESEINGTEPDDLNETTQTREFTQTVVKGNLNCTCGIPNTRIVGGTPVSISDLPWTVALVRKRNDSKPLGPYCGGTLVSNRYVVTASHCVDGFEAEKIQVWLNEEDFRVEDENLSNTIRVDVEEIIMHEMYDKKKIDNDIALLKLAQPVDIENGVVTPACIPADNTNTFDNEEAIVAGWGATEQGGTVSAKLNQVTVPIISNKKCNWRTLYLGRITDNQLCAGDVSSGGKDSCQGDSGGPLIVRSSEPRAILVGVVSYGFGCAKPYAPGVYTRVSQYPKWIVEKSQDGSYCGN